MNSCGYSAPSYAQNSFPTTTGESENRPPNKGSNSSSYLSNSRHLDRDKMDEEPALDTNSKIEFEKHNVL